MTGSMPGIPSSTNETWLFGSPPNSVEAPENSFDLDVTWAWTSSPITISQSPVAPLISFALVALMLVQPQAARKPSAPIRCRANRPPPAWPRAGTNSRHCRDRLRHDADKHGPRLRQRLVRPARSCAPDPNRLWPPTIAPPAARPIPARVLRPTGWL